MNIASMMKQAQQMQKKLQEAQTELANTEFTAVSGNGAVTAICDGQGKFKALKLTKAALNPENPDSVDDIGKLMEYYLPTTIKLLEAYEELDAQPVQGENILSSRREIEKTIDTLNTAFEKLLDDLFQDTSWDVSSDISVLEMMLAQDGLTEDGLKKKR